MECQHLLPDYEPKIENEPEIGLKVVTADVAALIKRIVRPNDEEDSTGASVSLVAEKANTSTRTVYRVLSESTPTIQLDLADRLCIAVHSHLAACRIVWPDGTITPYIDADLAEIMAL